MKIIFSNRTKCFAILSAIGLLVVASWVSLLGQVIGIQPRIPVPTSKRVEVVLKQSPHGQVSYSSSYIDGCVISIGTSVKIRFPPPLAVDAWKIGSGVVTFLISKTDGAGGWTFDRVVVLYLNQDVPVVSEVINRTVLGKFFRYNPFVSELLDVDNFPVIGVKLGYDTAAEAPCLTKYVDIEWAIDKYGPYPK